VPLLTPATAPHAGAGSAMRPLAPRLKIPSSETHLSPNALRALVARAKRMPVTDCLVTLGASGAAAQCGACSTLESGVVHVSRRHDTPRVMARQQETLRFYLQCGRRVGVRQDDRGSPYPLAPDPNGYGSAALWNTHAMPCSPLSLPIPPAPLLRGLSRRRGAALRLAASRSGGLGSSPTVSGLLFFLSAAFPLLGIHPRSIHGLKPRFW